MFDPSSPLVSFMRFHAAATRSDWPSASNYLRTYMKSSQLTDASSALGGMRWVRRVADELVGLMYERCNSDYERLHVLDLLANANVSNLGLLIYDEAGINVFISLSSVYFIYISVIFLNFYLIFTLLTIVHIDCGPIALNL